MKFNLDEFINYLEEKKKELKLGAVEDTHPYSVVNLREGIDESLIDEGKIKVYEDIILKLKEYKDGN